VPLTANSPVSVTSAALLVSAGGSLLLLADGAGGGGVADPGPSAGFWLAAGGILTALATGFFQPWLRERRTAERLDDALKRLDAAEARQRATEARLNAVEGEKAKALSLLASTQERLLRMIQHMLITNQRQRPGEPWRHESLLIGAEDPDAPPGPTVLIVEDDRDARVPQAELLGLLRFKVLTAERLDEGLQMLDESPDFVLLDLMLPDGDGVEILRRVREAKVPCKVIVTTAKPPDQWGQVQALGPDRILQKPYDFAADLLPLLRAKV
jgi:CheY-like chemotaxis protein